MNMLALLMGGFGGGISVEVVEADTQCRGEDAMPYVSDTPEGNIEASPKNILAGNLEECVHTYTFSSLSVLHKSYSFYTLRDKFLFT